jgi:hypothetical protein
VTYATHVAPGTTSEERVVSTWESRGTFDHAATVTRENPLFPVGSQLQDRTVYFSEVAPVLNGSYVFGYSASDGGELTASVDLDLVTRSVAEGDGEDGGTVFWETTRTLRESGPTTVRPGRTTEVPFSVNVSAVGAERDRIESGLGGTPGTLRTVVQATVDVEGTVNGRAVDTRQVHSLPVALEGNTYRVGPVDPQGEQFRATRTVTRTRTYGPLRSIGGPALCLVGLAGLAAVGVARSRGRIELTPAERSWLDYREQRSEFDEWITTFSLPPEAFDRPRAEAASLGDLVDFAIDTDGGVVESPDGDAYYVVGEEFVYAYTAPGRDHGPATPPGADPDASRERLDAAAVGAGENGSHVGDGDGSAGPDGTPGDGSGAAGDGAEPDANAE